MSAHSAGLLRERQERIKRNERMLKGVLAAAEDVEEQQTRQSAAESEAKQARSAARDARILASTRAAGPRASSTRASTLAAKQRIAQAFEQGVPSVCPKHKRKFALLARKECKAHCNASLPPQAHCCCTSAHASSHHPDPCLAQEVPVKRCPASYCRQRCFQRPVQHKTLSSAEQSSTASAKNHANATLTHYTTCMHAESSSELSSGHRSSGEGDDSASSGRQAGARQRASGQQHSGSDGPPPSEASSEPLSHADAATSDEDEPTARAGQASTSAATLTPAKRSTAAPQAAPAGKLLQAAKKRRRAAGVDPCTEGAARAAAPGADQTARPAASECAQSGDDEAELQARGFAHLMPRHATSSLGLSAQPVPSPLPLRCGRIRFYLACDTR